MRRKVWEWAVATALGVIVAAWLAAVIVARTRPHEANSFTAGCAWGERWLISAVVHADGFVRFQYFDDNLTPYRGLYVKLSGMADYHRFSARDLIPRASTGRAANRLTMHLVLPLLIFGVLFIRAWFVPLLRRRKRRRLGRCLNCGYDLRAATSPTCSECGATNPQVQPAEPKRLPNGPEDLAAANSITDRSSAAP